MWFSSWIFLGSLKLINSQQDVAWLVVSTTLKNISQLGLLFPIYKHCSKPPTRDISLIFKLVHHGQPIFKLHLDISRNPIIPIEFLPTSSSHGMNQIMLTSLLIAKHIPSEQYIYIYMYYHIIIYCIILCYIKIISYYIILKLYYTIWYDNYIIRYYIWYINIYVCIISWSYSVNRLIVANYTSS